MLLMSAVGGEQLRTTAEPDRVVRVFCLCTLQHIN